MWLGALRIGVLDLCDLVGDKKSLGYEFPSPFFFNALSALKKLEEKWFTIAFEVHIQGINIISDYLG